MESEPFYLSDDSDGEYEEDRRRKFAYDELVLLALEKQQHAALYGQEPEFTLPPWFQKIQNGVTSAQQKSSSALGTFRRDVSSFISSCRIESIFACTLLFGILCLMMNAPLPSEMEVNLFENRNETDLLGHYQYLADLYGNTEGDIHTTPFFWKIPFSGDQTFEEIFRVCVQAERMDGPPMGLEKTELTVVSTANIAANEQNKLPDKIIISSDAYQIASIFTQRNVGRAFTIMKNPIHRTIDKYLYLTGGPEPAVSMSFQEYLDSPYSDDNLMTRALTGKLQNPVEPLIQLTQEDLDLAMKILSQKFFVGLHPRMTDFMGRLDEVFHWEMKDKEMMQCRQSMIENSLETYNESLYPPESSELWNTALTKNWFDLQLYRFAETLFEAESSLSFR